MRSPAFLSTLFLHYPSSFLHHQPYRHSTSPTSQFHQFAETENARLYDTQTLSSPCLRNSFSTTISPSALSSSTPQPTSPYSSPSQSSDDVTERAFEFTTWNDVERLAVTVNDQVKADIEEGVAQKVDLILAVTRGGLIPATLLCQSLELRTILTTTVIFYTDHGDQFFGLTEPRFLSFPSPETLKDRHVLIVDDVWDSGRTACAVKNRVLRAMPKSVRVAVLHFKALQNRFNDAPDYYGQMTDNWLVYPWESLSPSSPSCESDEDKEDQGKGIIDNNIENGDNF